MLSLDTKSLIRNSNTRVLKRKSCGYFKLAKLCFFSMKPFNGLFARLKTTKLKFSERHSY